MLPFDCAFPEVARREARVLYARSHPALPAGAYVFREFYCNDPGCDCRRVILHVHLVEQRRVVATINHAFQPALPPFEDEPQTSLDPLNLQSELSDVLLGAFVEVMVPDRPYQERLVRHYEMWKQAVDDPRHPAHARVRGRAHGDPSFTPAFPPPTSPRRTGVNERCPCGSGKKFKRCCRA